MDLHGVAVGSGDSSAVFISNRAGVWRSLDRGDNWENTHFENFSPIIYSRGVQADPSDPSTLYAWWGVAVEARREACYTPPTWGRPGTAFAGIDPS